MIRWSFGRGCVTRSCPLCPSQAQVPMQHASATSSVPSSCQAIHRTDFNEMSGFLSLMGLAERSSQNEIWASFAVGGACIPNVLSMFVCSPDSATHTCLFRHTDFPTVQEAGCMLRTLKTASMVCQILPVVQAAKFLGHKPVVPVIPVEPDEQHIAAAKVAAGALHKVAPYLPYSA